MLVEIIANMPESEYHARKSENVVSKSQLVEIIAGGHAAFLHSCRVTSEPSTAMEIGSIVHSAVLEGKTELPEHIAVKPADMSFASRDGKDWRQQQIDAGKTIISSDDADAIKQMIDAASLPCMSPYLRTPGKSELSVFVEDAEFGITRAIRVDRLPHTGNIVVDLKTARESDKYGFAKAVSLFRYDMQAAYYLDTLAMAGIKRDMMVFVVLQNTRPYRPSVFVMDDTWVENGRIDYRRALRKVRDLNRNWMLPETLEPPRWMASEINEKLIQEEEE